MNTLSPLPVSPSVAAALRVFVPEMRRQFGDNLRRIILFGSQARGEARPDSDVDVLVLFGELVGGRRQVRRRIIDITHDLLLDYQALITTVLTTETRYQAMREPLFLNVEAEGIDLMPSEQTQLMQLAEDTLRDAQALLTATQGYRSAVSRAYYAMFYAAEAALLTREVRTKSHAGLINQFGQHLVKAGLIEASYSKQLQQAFETRQEGDYEIAAEISDSDAHQTCQDARAFIDRIQVFLAQTG